MLDHVAILVGSIESALAVLTAHTALRGVEIGPIESFPSEGTREMYLGEPGRAGRVLLLEAVGAEGPYARALRKRGPGLHHLAFRAPNLEEFFEAHPGWLMHPISLETREKFSTVWLARPGVPLLLEVVEVGEPLAMPGVVGSVRAPVPAELHRLTDPLGIRTGAAALIVGDEAIEVAAIAGAR